MSKSLGNIVNPEEVAGKYGRDVLRFALLRSDPANDFYFSWREMSSVYKFFTILMNVYNYFATYCTYEKLDERVVKEEDKWLLSKFNSLLKAVLYECKRYHGYRALQLIEKFVVEDLSRWYVKLVRDRNDRGVSAVLSYVLENLLKLLAPAIPFLTEYLYQRHFRSFAKRESVHLCDYPRAEERFLNENLEKAMSVCKEIAEACFSARHDAKIKLRYPLRNMKIVASEQAIKHVKSLEGVLKKICNVKEITYEIGEMEYGVKLNYALIGKRLGRKVKEIEREIANLDIVALKREMEERGFVTVAGERVGKDELVFVPKGKGYEFSHGYVTLDTGVDESLKKEWLLRELVRSVQETRKKLGLKVGEEAKLLVSRELEGELRGFFETLEKETNCRVEVVENLEGAEELEFEGKKYRFGVAR